MALSFLSKETVFNTTSFLKTVNEQTLYLRKTEGVPDIISSQFTDDCATEDFMSAVRDNIKTIFFNLESVYLQLYHWHKMLLQRQTIFPYCHWQFLMIEQY